MYDAINDTNRSLGCVQTPQRCHVTTMTFTATLSHTFRVQPETIATFAGLDDDYFTAIGPSAFSTAAIEFVAASMPSIRTRLFNNGAVQLTGCKSHVEAMHTLAELCRVLSGSVGAAVEAETMKCALINMNVVLETGIRLSVFADAVRARGYIAEQPERPPSCILKLPSIARQKPVTVLVYKAGKFVICGASTPQDVALAYERVMRVCDELHATILEPRTPGPVRTRGSLAWTRLVQCGMPGLMHAHQPTTRHAIEGCVYCARRGNLFFDHHVSDHAPRP